jgi:hypothetical protein
MPARGDLTVPYAYHGVSDGVPTPWIAQDLTLLEQIAIEAALHDDHLTVELCELAVHGSPNVREAACDAIYAKLGGR